MGKKRRCKPSLYAVIERNGSITYGFRCARCRLHGVRFDTGKERDRAVKSHLDRKLWK